MWWWLVLPAVTVVVLALGGVRRWPVSTYRGILSGFGVSRDGGTRRHAACDVGALRGDLILALDEGEVLHMVTGYGIGAGLQAVCIRHPDADFLYCEIRVNVTPGQRVRPGQPIGYADLNSDGNSMLHLEAWQRGRAPKGFTRWIGGQPPPAGLLDVGAILETLKPKKKEA